MAIALKTPVDPGDAPPMLSPVFMDDPSVQGGQQQQLARLPFMNSGPDVVQPSPTQQLINSDQARLEKVRMAQARPYGFEGAGPSAEFPEGLAPNHPGKLGHVLHALSVAGNIAGNIVNPNAMALIPQTQLGMKAEESGLTNRIGKEAEEESQNQARGAQTAHEQAATEALRNPQEKYTTLDTDQGEMRFDPKTGEAAPLMSGGKQLQGPNKQGAPVLHETDQGLMLVNPDTKEITPLTLNGKPLMPKAGKAERPDTPEQQYLDEYQKTHPGSTIAQAEKQYKTDTQAPQQPQRALMMVPDGKGGFTATEVMPGQHVGEGALTAGGLNSTNVPTSATRTMAETAPKVIDLANRSEQLIDQQIKTLGPAASRWQEFMAGKVGAPNPEFTKLRTNIGLLQTALMRMHVGARGGEQIMAHFADLIDSSKQDPQNLKAALDEIKAYADEVGKSGGGATARETTEAGAKGEAQEPIVQKSPSTGQFRHSTDGGKTWMPGKP